MTTEVADDPMCCCGERKSEHYDEVDPSPFYSGDSDGLVDRCSNRSWCGCEGFEEETP